MLASWDGQLCNKWGAGVAGFFFAEGIMKGGIIGK
jgi:hypothetical protein